MRLVESVVVAADGYRFCKLPIELPVDWPSVGIPEYLVIAANKVFAGDVVVQQWEAGDQITVVICGTPRSRRLQKAGVEIEISALACEKKFVDYVSIEENIESPNCIRVRAGDLLNAAKKLAPLAKESQKPTIVIEADTSTVKLLASSPDQAVRQEVEIPKAEGQDTSITAVNPTFIVDSLGTFDSDQVISIGLSQPQFDVAVLGWTLTNSPITIEGQEGVGGKWVIMPMTSAGNGMIRHWAGDETSVTEAVEAVVPCLIQRLEALGFDNQPLPPVADIKNAMIKAKRFDGHAFAEACHFAADLEAHLRNVATEALESFAARKGRYAVRGSKNYVVTDDMVTVAVESMMANLSKNPDVALEAVGWGNGRGGR